MRCKYLIVEVQGFKVWVASLTEVAACQIATKLLAAVSHINRDKGFKREHATKTNNPSLLRNAHPKAG